MKRVQAQRPVAPKSFCPPRFKCSRWLGAAAVASAGVVASLVTLAENLRPQQWAQVPARLVNCEYSSNWLGRAQLRVRYAYEFGGGHFEGHRPGLLDRTGKLEVAEAYSDQRPVSCYVNPSNPREATLCRDVAPPYWLLPMAFAGVAGVLAWGARRALVQQRIADAATLFTLETGVLDRWEHPARKAA